MVDFPEGYGFAPNHGAKIMQESFLVDIGVFRRSERGSWVQAGRRMNRSPYEFNPIGRVIRDNGELFGYIESGTVYGSKITGTLQEICTAICTVHRMTGGNI